MPLMAAPARCFPLAVLTTVPPLHWDGELAGDFWAPNNTPWLAVYDGWATPMNVSLGGNALMLYHVDGTAAYYAHGTPWRASGPVHAGDVIGYLSDSGNARGMPHLHFAVGIINQKGGGTLRLPVWLAGVKPYAQPVEPVPESLSEPVAEEPYVDHYTAWAAARQLLGEDPYDLPGFRLHLARLGADPALYRLYGWPDIPLRYDHYTPWAAARRLHGDTEDNLLAFQAHLEALGADAGAYPAYGWPYEIPDVVLLPRQLARADVVVLQPHVIADQPAPDLVLGALRPAAMPLTIVHS